MRTIEHWIGGSSTAGDSTRTSVVWNPATGAQQANLLLAEKSDVDRAVAAALAASGDWADSSLSRRTNSPSLAGCAAAPTRSGAASRIRSTSN